MLSHMVRAGEECSVTRAVITCRYACARVSICQPDYFYYMLGRQLDITA